MFLILFLSPSLPQPQANWKARIITPPPSLHADPFYQKCILVDGISILSAKVVRDEALVAAATIVTHMLRFVRKDAVRRLSRDVRIVIIGAHQQTTDIPEYRKLNTLFPGTNWNTRTRGIGATDQIPISSGAEENLLGLPGDKYKGEGIFVHEFGHTIADMGLAKVDSTFNSTLKSDYDQAIAAGLWKNTYAATNEHEYWAEGVQDYFDCNVYAFPSNGVHNNIVTRSALKLYDRPLFNLLLKTFGDNPWLYKYPTQG